MIKSYVCNECMNCTMPPVQRLVVVPSAVDGSPGDRGLVGTLGGLPPGKPRNDDKLCLS